MKRKMLFLFGIIAIVTITMYNGSLSISKQSDLNLSNLMSLAQAQAEFDPCPVNPIPYHCAWAPNWPDICFYTNQCIVICIEGC
ncbi:MAG: hypothetical protein HC831_03960 [Chloroflexia bacterium]|nr:hypothetical protein [Chloroflexia bacterium]